MESGESSADKKSSAGQMFLFHHHTRVRIPVRNTLHSVLRLRLTFAAQIGNETVTASYYACSGTDAGKAGEVSITFRPTGKQV